MSENIHLDKLIALVSQMEEEDVKSLAEIASNINIMNTKHAGGLRYSTKSFHGTPQELEQQYAEWKKIYTKAKIFSSMISKHPKIKGHLTIKVNYTEKV